MHNSGHTGKDAEGQLVLSSHRLQVVHCGCQGHTSHWCHLSSACPDLALSQPLLLCSPSRPILPRSVWTRLCWVHRHLRGAGLQVAERAGRQGQREVHGTPTFPTLDNHSTHATVEGGVTLEPPGRVNRLVNYLLTEKREGKPWKYASGELPWNNRSNQKLKPRNKTVEKSKAKNTKRVLITFQL